jgi:HlyD family secretion protein
VPAPAEPAPAAPAATGKPRKPAKPVEVVFVVEGGRAVMVPVVRGISDESHVEIVKGLKEGQRVVTGSHRAINRDLQDGTSITLAER